MGVLGDIVGRVRSTGPARDALYLVVEKTVTFALGFYVYVLIARHLGPEQYGILSYVAACVAIAAPIATLGFSGPVVKSFVQDRATAELVISTTIALRLAVSGVLALLLVLLIGSGVLASGNGAGASEARNLAIVLSLQYFAQCLDVFEYYNQANGKIARTVRARFLAFLVVSALRVVAVYMGADVVTFAWLVVLQLALGFALIYAGIRPGVLQGPWVFDVAIARKLLGMGSFVVLAGFLNMAQARTEVILLERLVNLEAVGIYAAALSFMELFGAWGMIAVTVLLPRLLASEETDRISDAKLARMYRLTMLSYLACIPLVVLMSVVAWWMMADSYPGIHWVVLAMGVRPLLTFLGLTRSMSMLAENRLRYSAMCATAGLITAVGSAYLLIPILGVYGAVASGILSYTISNILIDAVLNRRYFRAFIGAMRSGP